ncbi:transcriptional adapter 3-like isoform X2 [Ornithodoros turicata]|uniref:Putative transcriptional adapter 3 isoform x2 n=2 Tax=Ornithodoros turicata TaxID=34597 RepID=A0A2R5LMA5_9ACAR
MKGKGKGSGSSSSSSASEECPLQFPDVSPLDHTTVCPRYTAVTQGDTALTLDDVDTLQLELETLLVSVCGRKRQLAHETQVLVSWQEKKIPLPTCTPGKRQRPSDGKPGSKKFKDGGKVFTGGRPPRKHIGTPASAPHHEEGQATPQTAPRNDAPNRFWASLEPYCAEITQDDLRMLEELIHSREDDAEYYRIPALGRHYAHRWAQEDLLEEQNEGAKATAAGDATETKPSRRTVQDSKEADRMLKGATKELEHTDTCPLGPLTQRLVSCLVEENLMCSVEDADVGGAAPLAVAGAAQLERRVRRELQEQGLLEEASAVDSSDDQVLAELRRCQAELRALSAHNSTQLATLLKRARDRLQEQELRKKLRIVDNEVLDVFRRISSTRQRKKSPTKKDREQALRALRDRQALVRQVDRLSAGGAKH